MLRLSGDEPGKCLSRLRSVFPVGVRLNMHTLRIVHLVVFENDLMKGKIRAEPKPVESLLHVAARGNDVRRAMVARVKMVRVIRAADLAVMLGRSVSAMHGDGSDLGAERFEDLFAKPSRVSNDAFLGVGDIEFGVC